MRRVVALLAAVLVSAGVAGCGGDGAEPGASKEATLVLDFQPNAVHAGHLRGARARATTATPGSTCEVSEPSASTDAPKLLEAGRAAVRDPRHPRPGDRPRARPRRGRGRADRAAAAGRGDRRGSDRGPPPAGPRGRDGRASPACPPTMRCSTRCSRPTGPTPTPVDRVTIGFQAVAALAAGKGRRGDRLLERGGRRRCGARGSRPAPFGSTTTAPRATRSCGSASARELIA